MHYQEWTFNKLLQTIQVKKIPEYFRVYYIIKLWRTVQQPVDVG